MFRRTLPSNFNSASLYASPGAGLGYFFKPVSAIDPSLLQCADLLVRPDDVVWDIGANVGLFSLAAAVRAGRGGTVLAFEPDVWLTQLLRRTSDIQPSGVAPITVIPAAVAGDTGFRSFTIARRSRASNALAEYGHSQMGGIAQTQVVPTYNLDWLLGKWPAPDVVKIDVEGAELEVLRCQDRLINEVRPILICEVAPRNAKEIGEILASAHYCMYDAETLRDARSLDRAAWNTVAIPDDKRELLPWIGATCEKRT